MRSRKGCSNFHTLWRIKAVTSVAPRNNEKRYNEMATTDTFYEAIRRQEISRRGFL
jgi:hypothetical protein